MNIKRIDKTIEHIIMSYKIQHTSLLAGERLSSEYPFVMGEEISSALYPDTTLGVSIPFT